MSTSTGAIGPPSSDFGVTGRSTVNVFAPLTKSMLVNIVRS